MAKESQLHRALRDYWKEKKQEQRERDEALKIKYDKENTGETFSQYKAKHKSTIPF